CPRTAEGRRFQPTGIVTQVIGFGRCVLKKVPVGIDRELQIVVLDRAPNWFAIEADQNCWCRAHEDLWWIGFEAIDVLWRNQTLVYLYQNAIESNQTIFFGQSVLDSRDDLLSLLFRKGLKIGFGNLQRRELHQALRERD